MQQGGGNTTLDGLATATQGLLAFTHWFSRISAAAQAAALFLALGHVLFCSTKKGRCAGSHPWLQLMMRQSCRCRDAAAPCHWLAEAVAASSSRGSRLHAGHCGCWAVPLPHSNTLSGPGCMCLIQTCCGPGTCASSCCHVSCSKVLVIVALTSYHKQQQAQQQLYNSTQTTHLLLPDRLPVPTRGNEGPDPD